VSKPLALPPSRSLAISSVDEVLALVRARGGRATASRRILLEVLFEADGHLSAEELAQAVCARAPDVHISTIYRNLEELQRMGVIVHSHLGHGAATYQLAALAHAHLICEECGARAARDKLGFTIDPHHFAILGHCESCG